MHGHTVPCVRDWSSNSEPQYPRYNAWLILAPVVDVAAVADGGSYKEMSFEEIVEARGKKG